MWTSPNDAILGTHTNLATSHRVARAHANTTHLIVIVISNNSSNRSKSDASSIYRVEMMCCVGVYVGDPWLVASFVYTQYLYVHSRQYDPYSSYSKRSVAMRLLDHRTIRSG